MFTAVLFVLPLAAQDTGAARQLQKLTQVYRYLNGLYVDDVDMQPLVRAPSPECSRSSTPIRPISGPTR